VVVLYLLSLVIRGLITWSYLTSIQHGWIEVK